MRKGYTLTEVIISVILISLIFAISVPVYYRMSTILPSEAQLVSVAQKLLFLLSDARKLGFLGNDVICIKYSNRIFETFVDNDLNAQPDNNKPISKIDLTVRDYENITLTFNGQQVTQISDLYTVDGVFAKKVGNTLDLTYSNATFQFLLQGQSIRVVIEDSLPKIIER
ncbi:MAG: prepilin-type N-terminal cleavage/methylation domain-containing protein [Fervidobacterium sp.]|nr:prepilin-type N-terminal cleavage/methylation domain-containing protein [Fervidobacterium sp.]